MAVSNPRTLTGVHDAYQSRSDALWLTGLILLAFALRIPGLDASLWYDEAYTLAHYVRPPLAETLLTYEALNNHVFHTVLAKASVTIFGESAGRCGFRPCCSASPVSGRCGNFAGKWSAPGRPGLPPY